MIWDNFYNSNDPAVDVFKIFWLNPFYQYEILLLFFPKKQPYTTSTIFAWFCCISGYNIVRFIESQGVGDFLLFWVISWELTKIYPCWLDHPESIYTNFLCHVSRFYQYLSWLTFCLCILRNIVFKGVGMIDADKYVSITVNPKFLLVNMNYCK